MINDHDHRTILAALVARAERLGGQVEINGQDLDAAERLDVEIVTETEPYRMILRRRDDSRVAVVRDVVAREILDRIRADVSVDLIVEDEDVDAIAREVLDALKRAGALSGFRP